MLHMYQTVRTLLKGSGLPCYDRLVPKAASYTHGSTRGVERQQFSLNEFAELVLNNITPIHFPMIRQFR